MQAKDILEELRKILSNEFKKEYVDYDTMLNGENNNCLDLNSLEIVKFIVAIENTFSIIVDFDISFNSVSV